ncbi:MAG: PASTA domain-containing protein [Actinomycetota bacterium]|nr:PASTA domain-containing protein [Actinomycetota bacterium]
MGRWLVVLAGVGALLFPALLLAARGDLDPTFGSGGKLRTDFGGSEIGSSVAVQRDKRVVVAGDRLNPDSSGDFVLARYTANGRLDPSFDGDGKVETDFGGGVDGAFDVQIQGDGKIVAAGRGVPTFELVAADFALARYRTDGSLDPTFGKDGKVVTTFQTDSIDSASAVLIQADGKIVAGGGTRGDVSTSDFALARYLPDGGLDPSFGSGGRVITPISSAADHLFDLAFQADGKLVAAGWSFQGGGPHIALARYDQDGILDRSFDGDGIVIASFRSAGAHILVQRDGKLLVTGGGEVTRFSADGSLDGSFGEGGRARSGNVGAFATALQPDGKILVIGTVVTGSSPSGDFGVARLTGSGRLDSSYGRQGSVVTQFSSGSDDQALDGVLLPDGKLVVSGMSNATPQEDVWGPWDFAVARYVAVRFCVVPNVRRKTLGVARSALTKAQCKVGIVKRRYSTTVERGRVISQVPVPRTRLAELAKVALVVSRGRRR